jgi:acetyl esterase/lipase
MTRDTPHDGSRRRRRLPFDLELAAVLVRRPELTASLLPRHIERLRQWQSSPQARLSDAELSRSGAIAFEDRTMKVADGAELRLLVLRRADGTGPRPGLCFFHGGGMVAGDERTGIEAVLDWVEALDLVAVSVGYRLAPEHRHPTPVEDCHAGLVWLDRHRDVLALDGAPLLVAGTSAGGGLAAGVALLAQERKGPAISDLILMCPMLDDQARFPSSTEFDGDAVWDARSNLTGWEALLDGVQSDGDVPASAAPSRASSLAGFPPTYLDVGAVETFRDEVIDFGVRLAQAGVSTELHVWAGAFHGFDVLAPDTAVARAARAARVDYLGRRLRTRGAL